MTRSSRSSKWQAVHPSVACQQIARIALSPDTANVDDVARAELSSALGQITLREHQLDALLRVRVAMREFGGALLADAVGLGKTYVALALARDFSDVHILAPATLLPMWRSAIAITGSRDIVLHSLHRLSRGPIKTSPGGARSLVIVDEAHHLRTPATRRYANAVAFTVNREVLLLTATPLHNRERELRALLALFLGHRADALDNATLGRCVVRRSATVAGPTSIPSVREHPPHRLPDNHMVLECLLTLPPPLPVHEGVAASALVRLGLLRAWCSSDAALSESIRRRQLRGEALLHSLSHGRYPTHRELQSWIVGNDSVQLAFPELLVATASGDTAEMLKTLLAHLDGLHGLLQLHTRTSIADARRAELLRSLVGTEALTMNTSHLRTERRMSEQSEPAVPPAIVAFSQFACTVRALHRALTDLAGIASLTASGGRIASGAIARHELIASFAPHAHGRPPPPAHERIRLLLTTDLLAEGVNLQDAGVVVHLDLPWTDALRQQRVGRLARLGASHAVVDVHTFEPPMGADLVLRVVAALERKASLHRQYIGGETGSPAVGRGANMSGADEATQLREHWQSWQRADHKCCCPPVPASNTPCVARVTAAQNGWIAAIECENEALVVACCKNVGTDTATIYRAVKAIASRDFLECGPALWPSSCHAEPSTERVQLALDQLQQWIESRLLHQLAGPGSRTIAPAQKRALDAVASRFATVPAPSRATIAPLIADIERQILKARGAGAERVLEEWTSTSNTTAIGEWLALFPRARRAVAQSLDTRDVPTPPASVGLVRAEKDWGLLALLILENVPNPPTPTR